MTITKMIRMKNDAINNINLKLYKTQNINLIVNNKTIIYES